MTHPRRPAARRPGFTMVELLVVVALIATLAALSVGTVFRIRTAQQRSSSEATLQKLDTKLGEKIRLIEEQIAEDVRLKKPGTGAGELHDAGYPPETARSILMYARLRNQLPTTFTEAVTPTPIPGTSIVLPPSVVFVATVGPLLKTGDINESAVLIHLALSQSGGGNEGLSQQIGDVTVNGSTQKCYLDAYGQPIAFVRLAYDGNLNEINLSPLTKNPAVDPFDPANKPTTATILSVPAVWAAVKQPVMTEGGSPCFLDVPVYRAVGTNRNHLSAVVSAGPNKVFLDGPGLSMLDGDNLVSYRLRREGQKGD